MRESNKLECNGPQLGKSWDTSVKLCPTKSAQQARMRVRINTHRAIVDFEYKVFESGWDVGYEITDGQAERQGAATIVQLFSRCHSCYPQLLQTATPFDLKEILHCTV